MLLHKNKKEFKELIKFAADYYMIPEYQVEKDYYVSFFLKELMEISKETNFVFKGGTSLSKCFNVIKRFSEDIDLTVLSDEGRVTSSQKQTIKRNIVQACKNCAMSISNISEVKSRGMHNIYKISYDNEYEVESDISNIIALETIVAYQPYPVKTKQVNNYITKFLEENNKDEIIRNYQLAPFTVLVQSLTRTFVDKLFAICDYHLKSEYNRHVWPI